MTEQIQKASDRVAAFAHAFFFGMIIELLAEMVRNLIGVLPDPFLDVASLTNLHTLSNCGLYLLFLFGSLLGIWICAGKTEGLRNPTHQKLALLVGILTVAIVAGFHEHH
jgi:hypothetical protein